MMRLAKCDPFLEMGDIFERYNRALDWPRRGGQETMSTEALRFQTILLDYYKRSVQFIISCFIKTSPL
jgi:hypothetical protein